MYRMRLLVLLALCAAGLILPTRSTARPLDKKHAPEKKEIVACRISLGDVGEGDGMTLDLRITERKFIKQLIEGPLRTARPDPDPDRYKILGSVTLRYKGGSEGRFILFRPWGRYKVGDKYMIADFSGIQKAFKKAIANAERRALRD